MIVEEKFAQFVSLCEGKPSKVVRLLYQQLPLSFEVQLLLVSLSHDSLVALPHLMGLPTYKRGHGCAERMMKGRAIISFQIVVKVQLFTT